MICATEPEQVLINNLLLDDQNSLDQYGLRGINPADPWAVKQLVTNINAELNRQGKTMKILLIVGGDGIIPFHKLPNPTGDDDPFIPSDNPYGSIDENYQPDECEPGPENCYEAMEGAMVLKSAIETLPDVDRRVLIMRFGMDGFSEHTLRQIGEAFSLTKQRIEQIEKKAISKLKKNRQVKNFFYELL